MPTCTGIWHKELHVDHTQDKSYNKIEFNEFAKSGPKTINVQALITSMGTYNNNCSARVYIESYVSNGQPKSGNGASLMYIPNATHVTIAVELKEGYVNAAAMVFVWG